MIRLNLHIKEISYSRGNNSLAINVEDKNEYYEEGYGIGSKFSIDDVFIFGVSRYIVTAPITYFIVTKSHPKPKNEILETIDNNCKTCFLEGYEKGSLKRRKSSILFGYSVLPTALLIAFLLGAITQGKFPPEL